MLRLLTDNFKVWMSATLSICQQLYEFCRHIHDKTARQSLNLCKARRVGSSLIISDCHWGLDFSHWNISVLIFAYAILSTYTKPCAEKPSVRQCRLPTIRLFEVVQLIRLIPRAKFNELQRHYLWITVTMLIVPPNGLTWQENTPAVRFQNPLPAEINMPTK